MMASTSQSNEVESDGSYLQTLLAKLTSTVISETTEAKDEIHQLLLTDSYDSHTILGDLFNLYVSSDCQAAAQVLVDQSQQRHVMVGCQLWSGCCLSVIFVINIFQIN